MDLLPGSTRGRMLWVAALPLLLLAVYLSAALRGKQRQEPRHAAGARTDLSHVCTFPGAGAAHRRLVVTIVDSMRDETALDPKIMPWLSARPKDTLFGHMQPCLSQLSLLCFRTMFEGAEPIFVTGFNNYTGMAVETPSLITRLAARGVHVAAVADDAFIKLYEPSLTYHANFDERTPDTKSRDEFGRKKTFEWLADPNVDMIVSHVIDTDGTAHRYGVGGPEYVAKFRETDDFLRELDARLGPNDSMITLGDHGHDVHGYHSTGIPSITAYFARGPLFPAGTRHDTRMPTTYFFMAAATCEPVPPRYSGEIPVSALAFPPEYRAAYQHIADAEPPQTERASVEAVLISDAPVVALLLIFGFVALQASKGLAFPPRALLVTTVGLLPGLVLPSIGWLWGAAIAGGASLRRAVAWDVWKVWSLVAALAAFALGFLTQQVLVPMQNQVNTTWTIGFWIVLAASILVVAWAFSRTSQVRYRESAGIVAWAGIFFCLFLGPYYYSSGRNLMFGVTWVLFVAALGRARPGSGVWRSVAGALLPLIPLHLPHLTEWQPRYFVLEFAQDLGAGLLLALVVVLTAAAAFASGEPRRWLRPALVIVGLSALALVTELRQPLLLAAVLLAVSYVAFDRAAERLEAVDSQAPIVQLLRPIGQASYAFMLYFAMLGSLRFANVDFRFALRFAPMENGEASAALTAVPFVSLKYLVPVVIFLALARRVDARSLALLMFKGLCLLLMLFGMQVSGNPHIVLFSQLQSQEVTLFALFFACTLTAYACLLGRGAREPEAASEVQTA